MARNIPIIKLYDNLLVSIQIELSDTLVAELKDNICDEIKRTGATGLIIEVSGVDVLDSYIARSIRDISHIVRLMGVKSVIAGLDPSMAITLVEMGLQFGGVITSLNIETALAALAAESKAQATAAEALTEEEPDDPILFEEAAK
jgi:rsbT antagonist protein RsbS